MAAKTGNRADQGSAVEVVDSGDDLVARWARAEQAFDLVRLKGKYLRVAAEELGVSHTQVWNDIRAFEQYLAQAHGTGTLAEKRAAFEQLVLEVLAECRAILKDHPSKPLVKVGALNTMNSALTHLRAVRGLDAPKEVKKDPGPVQFRVSWADPEDQ